MPGSIVTIVKQSSRKAENEDLISSQACMLLPYQESNGQNHSWKCCFSSCWQTGAQEDQKSNRHDVVILVEIYATFMNPCTSTIFQPTKEPPTPMHLGSTFLIHDPAFEEKKALRSQRFRTPPGGAGGAAEPANCE